jgi:hypothetical protein
MEKSLAGAAELRFTFELAYAVERVLNGALALGGLERVAPWIPMAKKPHWLS